MSISIAQSRQHLSELIAAAQTTPQVITKHNAPVAVLVSTDYFKRSEAAVKTVADNFYSQLVALRNIHSLDDNSGLDDEVKQKVVRADAWKRSNEFVNAK